MCEVPYSSFDKSETNKRNNVELRVSKVHKACADGWLLREMSFEIMTDPPEFLGCADHDLQIRTIMLLARKHLKLRVSR